MTVREAVKIILLTSDEARNNDNECIYLTLRILGKPTDFRAMRHNKTNEVESIRRTRQMIQKQCPWLRADAPTEASRDEKEERVRAFASGLREDIDL